MNYELNVLEQNLEKKAIILESIIESYKKIDGDVRFIRLSTRAKCYKHVSKELKSIINSYRD